MSWVDLLALTITLWSAVRGYLCGVYETFLHLVGTGAALLAAVFLYKPLAVFANETWEVEGLFVVYFTQHAGDVPAITQSTRSIPVFPALVSSVIRFLMPEAVTTVITKDEALHYLAYVSMRLLAFVLFFIFLFVLIRYCFYYKQEPSQIHHFVLWQRLGGLFMGVMHGVVLAIITCIALEALVAFLYPGFLQVDCSNSYVSRFGAYAISWFSKSS